LKSLLWIVVFLTACSAPDAVPPQSTTSSQTAAGDTVADATAPVTAPSTIEEIPSPVTTPPDGNVTIESVQAANPVVVRGQARTFESNVALRVRAADGSLISESFTTAQGEMGRHSPYEGTLWLTRDPGARITVEALEYSARDGSEQSLVSVTRPFDVERIEATLYFADQACSGVKPYKRRIPKTVSMARLLAEALIGGPVKEERDAGAVGMFPNGSRVQSVNLREGVLTIDLNERLQNVGGACRAQMIRASLMETLGRLPSVRKVVITAGGSEKLALQP
jgi:hypothetical protein